MYRKLIESSYAYRSIQSLMRLASNFKNINNRIVKPHNPEPP